MSEQASNIGDENQSFQQSFQSQTSFEPPFEGIKTELHTIVDKLQRDEPSGEPPRRPLWQRVLIWQIPIWLVAFLVVLSYNPRVDSCGGVKINYKTQTLCIANDNDFFLFVEHFACDFIEKDAVAYDSLQMDSMAKQNLQNYFTKYDFLLEKQPTEVEVLRGMQNAGYDSTSFYKNVAVAFWNAGVRLLNEGETDSACGYFKKLEQWNGADSVLTAADRAVIKRNCKESPIVIQPVTPPKKNEKPKTPPKTKQEPIKTEPNPRQLNLKAQTTPPSVSFGKKPDLVTIEQPNRQNPVNTGATDPKAQQATIPIVTTTEYVGKTAFDLVQVKGGTFMMGCTDEKDKDCDDNEKPPHQVSVSDFYIGKTEVTQKQWREVMGTNPSNFKNCDNCPVENVSWEDIQTFLQKMNSQTKGRKYRLPTEAEWEFAARGGNYSKGFKYSGSNNIDDVAWYRSNSKSKTYPVGQKKANELGLYDMSGNVYEWCSDWYDSYKDSDRNTIQNNPTGAEKGTFRVFRGGSWYPNPQYCRVSGRFNDAPTYRDSNVGFRVVFVP